MSELAWQPLPAIDTIAVVIKILITGRGCLRIVTFRKCICGTPPTVKFLLMLLNFRVPRIKLDRSILGNKFRKNLARAIEVKGQGTRLGTKAIDMLMPGAPDRA